MSDPDYWNLVEEIFSAVVDLDDATARSRLCALTVGREDVREEVATLLESHARATDRMPDAAAALIHEGVGPASGDRVGPFRLTECIGEGGMGSVYRAVRADGDFTQQVAIKLIDAPMGHPDARRRFRAERQILADLHHPNIVSLIDGGITPEGLAYLVMEYVEGDPISSYCRQRHLSLRARLSLVRDVCAAVQYSHQSLVVHRDLKPANILVTADGLVKVLDFGVAKLLTPEARHELTVTGVENRALTPNYASPEQLRGLPANPASDVYALGVLLFELLTGARPYDTAGKPLDETLRIVLEQEPPRPSTGARAGSGVPYALRLLRGDLDAIVLRALRKVPEERYNSAGALADDIGRYLEGKPVNAREPSLGYVVRKLADRHKAVFVSTTVSLVAVVALLVVSLWEGRTARLERDRARAEATKVGEMNTFLGSVFAGANPVQARGQTVTAKDLLDRGTASISGKLDGQPEVQASLLMVMAEAYRQLNEYAKALDAAERALALRKEALGPSHVDVAASLQLVGSLHWRLGHRAGAMQSLEQALSLRERLLGADDRSVAETLSALALAKSANGEAADARTMIERAISIEERRAPRSAHLGLLYNTLATSLHEDGDLGRAEHAYQQSIDVYEKSTEPEAWSIALPLLNLATLLREREGAEAFSRAEELFTRALAIDEAVFGRESAGVAYTLGCLGDLARARGDLDSAHALLDRSLEMYRKTTPGDDVRVAAPTMYLGQVFLSEGRPGEALRLLERALQISERNHNEDHPDVAETLAHLAEARLALRDLAGAEPSARRALTIQRKALSADHPALVTTLTVLGRILQERGRNDEARSHFEEAVHIAQSRLVPENSRRHEAERALRELRHDS